MVKPKYKISKSYKDDQFLFNLDGLIKGQYVKIETDSEEVIREIIKLMDSPTKPYRNNG